MEPESTWISHENDLRDMRYIKLLPLRMSGKATRGDKKKIWEFLSAIIRESLFAFLSGIHIKREYECIRRI